MAKIHGADPEELKTSFKSGKFGNHRIVEEDTDEGVGDSDSGVDGT
ncbi:MAG: hypothetical protein HQ492_02565 [Woeseiaceae bacterium]|nr:hypothetical protein [Woeseiaceae bacterium]